MANKKKPAGQEVQNSMPDFASGLLNAGVNPASLGTPINQVGTMFINLRWYYLSNYRQLLSQMYVEHGIVQTLVDLPVDDAFRVGFDIKSSQLQPDDIKQVHKYLRSSKALRKFMQTIKWSRLFGGGGLLIITGQDPATPLDITKLNKNSKIEFRACDLWELYNTQANIQGDMSVSEDDQEYYVYYGITVHHTRVIKFLGKEAPSFVRPRLRGWGMSVMEHMVRSLNQFLKNENVLFSMMDEAKIDVYKIQDFNSGLMTKAGTNIVLDRVQKANQIKSFNNAIVMDTEDDYIQKTISFSGLGEVLEQIRVSLAADTKFPMTKLFGLSSAGFNSGDDDIENYNGMVEGEVRDKCKDELVELCELACQILFGIIPDDLEVDFRPLRVLSAEQEEKVKDSQFERLNTNWKTGGMETEEYKEALNTATLLPNEIDVNVEAELPIEPPTATMPGKPGAKQPSKKGAKK